MVRDGDSFDRGVKGDVVAGSSHHVLLKISGQVGLVFGRDRLDRAVENGERRTENGERASIDPGPKQRRVIALGHDPKPHFSGRTT